MTTSAEAAAAIGRAIRQLDAEWAAADRDERQRLSADIAALQRLRADVLGTSAARTAALIEAAADRLEGVAERLEADPLGPLLAALRRAPAGTG